MLALSFIWVILILKKRRSDYFVRTGTVFSIKIEVHLPVSLSDFSSAEVESPNISWRFRGSLGPKTSSTPVGISTHVSYHNWKNCSFYLRLRKKLLKNSYVFILQFRIKWMEIFIFIILKMWTICWMDV